MVISNYDVMDSIVNANPKLHWDGWNVAFDKETPNGYTHFNGVFKNGKWHIRKVFKLEKSGWNIPDKFVGRDVQMV